MPTYVKNALLPYHHQVPTTKQYSPSQWKVHTYGQKVQFTTQSDTSAPMTQAQTSRLKKKCWHISLLRSSIRPNYAISIR